MAILLETLELIPACLPQPSNDNEIQMQKEETNLQEENRRLKSRSVQNRYVWHIFVRPIDWLYLEDYEIDNLTCDITWKGLITYDVVDIYCNVQSRELHRLIWEAKWRYIENLLLLV